MRDIGSNPAKLEQARRIEHNMNQDRERRERLLEGAPTPDAEIPAAADPPPAVRSDRASPIRPAATAHTR
jgi:hypothetical protein